MITIRKAAEEDIHALSKKLVALLKNKNSRFYQENVTKFGIPEGYVKKALAEEKLLMAVASGKTDFYLALINNEIIGFAQTEQRDSHSRIRSYFSLSETLKKRRRHTTAKTDYS